MPPADDVQPRKTACTIPARGDPMPNALKCFAICVLCFVAQSARSDGPQPAVLQKHEGELRTRRPREGVATPSIEFLLKIGPKTNGSKHLLVLTEELHPGAVIQRHRHLGEDEVVLIQTGSAHVWLGNNEYDAKPGSLVFISAGTWISLQNNGPENIGLVSTWNEPA